MLKVLALIGVFTLGYVVPKPVQGLKWTHNRPDTVSVLSNKVCFTWSKDKVLYNYAHEVKYLHYACIRRFK